MYSPVARVTLVQFPVADIYLFKKQTYATIPKFVECHPSTKNEPLNSTCIYVTLSCHQSCFSNGRYVLSSMTTVSIISEDTKISFNYCTHICLYIYIYRSPCVPIFPDPSWVPLHVVTDFGPFWGIFGPPTQLLMPVPSERLVSFCHFSNNKILPTSQILV